ncbi:YdcF family protein [Commensalibacter melissae]|uniref:YdcF family protein n=1 Tax=Commensalibacter melissae TaxID=2070537 RepID=UPI0018C23DA2|nr:YdcF family protein [Commensalibacter melissae]
MGSRKKIDNADLLVVFGTKINEDGNPSAGLKARLDETVFVYRKHVAPLIFVSGGLGKEGYNEAKVMADYLLTQNIPREAVILDEKGVNTRATVRNVVELCTKQYFKSVIAISQYYHLPRIQLAFKQAGMPLKGQSAPRYNSWRDIFSLNREIVAYLFYWLKLK